MATPLGWSKAGSGSVCLALDQLRDVIESQEELIHQLRNVMVLQDENFVSKEEFQAVEKKLVGNEVTAAAPAGRESCPCQNQGPPGQGRGEVTVCPRRGRGAIQAAGEREAGL
ncbi:SPATA24 isoform 8 [Pan troglodytes]|uniref:SPATA24 isoform 8 n=1 Tax=Pan troglodytes TaxID=9598 RepID=A0A2J8JIH4_PANTR|nr:SPATA24 isoform 8 [Pan troglodytes]